MCRKQFMTHNICVAVARETDRVCTTYRNAWNTCIFHEVLATLDDEIRCVRVSNGWLSACIFGTRLRTAQIATYTISVYRFQVRFYQDILCVASDGLLIARLCCLSCYRFIWLHPFFIHCNEFRFPVWGVSPSPCTSTYGYSHESVSKIDARTCVSQHRHSKRSAQGDSLMLCAFHSLCWQIFFYEEHLIEMNISVNGAVE